MTAANGWPKFSEAGVPLHPERDGWHWVDECAREWSAAEQAWLDHAGDPVPASTYMRFRYLGPCHTPAEVQAREAAAAEAMREQAAQVLRKKASTYHAEHGSYDSSTGVTEYPGDGSDWMMDWEETADDIDALPAPDALARALAEAKREGMMEAAGMVETHADAAKRCSEEADVIHRIRAEYLAKAFALKKAAEDIRAAAGEVKP